MLFRSYARNHWDSALDEIEALRAELETAQLEAAIVMDPADFALTQAAKVPKLEAENAELRAMRDFLLSHFCVHSLHMGGHHSYRFQNGGWPLNHAKGPTAESAILAAMAEVAAHGPPTEAPTDG